MLVVLQIYYTESSVFKICLRQAENMESANEQVFKTLV